MVQIAINKTINFEAPKFNKTKFKQVIEYALSLTKNRNRLKEKMQQVQA